MGDYASIVAFNQVPDAAVGLAAAETALRDMGLIAGGYDAMAALASKSGRVARPGPRAAEVQGYGARLFEMLTNGVEFEGPRYFNAYGLGFSAWFECPDCNGRLAADDDVFGDQMSALGNAAVDWMDGAAAAPVVCLMCGAASAVTAWRLEDPVFVADIAVVFWNWPALPEAGQQDGHWWSVDVTGALAQAVGAKALVSGYKV